METDSEKIKSKKILRFLLAFVAIIFLCTGYFAWRILYKPNIFLKEPGSQKVYLFVPKGCNIDCLKNIVLEKVNVKDPLFFEWVMKIKGKISRIYPGKYLLPDAIGNKAMVDILSPGNRVAVKLTLKFFRKTDDLADFIAQQIDVNYDDLVNKLNDDQYLAKFGMNKHTVIAMFIPNTYFFNWNTSAEEFMARMHKEYEKYWTPERKEKAKSLGFSPMEVMTLSSIVDRETNWNSEKPRIAGVYINRLRKGMLLQADPTVVFAVNDFTIKRLRKGHLKTDSPYNTYLNTGLPPGPICTPAIATVNAVLNAETHSFLYFCAKEDFSGYHNFANNFSEHLAFARKFQKALNENDIE